MWSRGHEAAPTLRDKSRAQITDATRVEITDATRVEVTDATRIEVTDATRIVSGNQTVEKHRRRPLQRDQTVLLRPREHLGGQCRRRPPVGLSGERCRPDEVRLDAVPHGSEPVRKFHGTIRPGASPGEVSLRESRFGTDPCDPDPLPHECLLTELGFGGVQNGRAALEERAAHGKAASPERVRRRSGGGIAPRADGQLGTGSHRTRLGERPSVQYRRGTMSAQLPQEGGLGARTQRQPDSAPAGLAQASHFRPRGRVASLSAECNGP